MKEEPKHKDPVTKTQSFRQNRMKVSAPIPTVEDIATIKHKKKVCLCRHSAKIEEFLNNLSNLLNIHVHEYVTTYMYDIA